MALDPISAGIDLVSKITDKIWPDAGEAERAKIGMIMQTFQGQANIIQAEVASDSWLGSNWRPLIMLMFAGLICARWFGLSFEGITEAEYIEAWGLLKLGIGGYIGGRTVEKIAPSIVKAITGKTE